VISNKTTYKRNPDRLARIGKLREHGFTIDKIAAATVYPRSSVGYYVAKYCGGKARPEKRFGGGSEPETRTIRIETDSNIDPVHTCRRFGRRPLTLLRKFWRGKRIEIQLLKRSYWICLRKILKPCTSG
jgi:hypothetical protein